MFSINWCVILLLCMSYDLFGMDSSEGQLRKYQELKEERQAIKKSGQDLNSFQQELPIYIKDQKEKDQREYEERLVELNEKLIWLTMNPMSDPHEEWRATCTNFFLEEKQRREELKNMTNEELRAKMKQQDEEFDKLEKKQKEEKVQALPN